MWFAWFSPLNAARAAFMGNLPISPTRDLPSTQHRRHCWGTSHFANKTSHPSTQHVRCWRGTSQYRNKTSPPSTQHVRRWRGNTPFPPNVFLSWTRHVRHWRGNAHFGPRQRSTCCVDGGTPLSHQMLFFRERGTCGIDGGSPISAPVNAARAALTGEVPCSKHKISLSMKHVMCGVNGAFPNFPTRVLHWQHSMCGVKGLDQGTLETIEL